MFEIKLKNNKTFNCDKESTIFEAAKKNNIVIIGGTTTRIVDNKIYNTMLAGLPRSEVIEHDKIYLNPSEKKVGYLGEGNKVLILNYNGIKIAILVCYTSEFANVSLKLAEINPDLIIVPSYTDDIYGLSRIQTAAKMLSIQNFAYAVIVGMVSNKDINNLQNADGMSQALFTSPQQKGFALDHLVRATFNKEDMISYSFDISKLHNAKNNASSFPNSNQITKKLKIKN